MSHAAAILAAREITGRLSRPASRLEGLTARVLGSALLTQALPLGDVSPFSDFPEVVVTSAERVDGVGSTYRAEMLRPARSTRPSPPSVEPGQTSAAPASVFSFRRSGAGRVPEPGSRAMAAAPPSFTPPVTRGRPGSRPSIAARSEAADREVAARDAPSAGSASGPPSSGPLLQPAQRRPPGRLELIGALATELLAAPEPARRSAAALEPPAVRPVARALPRQDAWPAPELSGRDHDPLIAAWHAESAAAALAPSQMRAPAALPSEPRTPTAPTMPAVIGGGTRAPEVTTPIAPSFGRSLEAETLASLVNDVLAEQARRHGIDLS